MARSILFASLICGVMTLGMVAYDLYTNKIEPFADAAQARTGEASLPATNKLPEKQKALAVTKGKQAAGSPIATSATESPANRQSAPVTEKRAQVTVTALVRGLRNLQGQVIAQAFNKPGAFDNNRYDQALSTIMVNAKDFKGELHFRELPPGRYAIALFHDENGNQQFDQNGSSIEGYAYSNNAGKNAPASFQQAAFRADKDKKLIIRLIYH